jgi:5-formyltetrahydrofolate cyclo-ligase
LQNVKELAVGGFGILEPRPELRGDLAKQVKPVELDLVMVPGLAFDHRGGRLGHGKGYYDRLLDRVRRDAAVVAVAFECQVFPEIPMLEFDVFMDKVITERAIYEGRGR